MEVVTENGKINMQRGFTLVELLVVLLIVGLLAGLVGPSLYQKINPAKQSTALAQINSLSTALEGFFVDVGRYPTMLEGLDALITQPIGVERWNGPYLKKAIPNDPWGNEYQYLVPGTKGPFEILSLGADGKEGGEGDFRDISSWNG